MKTLTLATAALVGAATLLAGCSDGDADESSASDRPSESSSATPGEGGDGGDSGDSGADAFTEGSGAEIARTAKEAMVGLGSVRVTGTITSEGQQMAMDLAMSRSGECAGSIEIDEATVELLGIDGATWFRPDEAFWTMQAGEQASTIIDAVAGRWVVVPAEVNFLDFCQLDGLLESINDDADTTFEKGEVGEVAGQPAIAVASTDEEGGSFTAQVQVEGEHYLLELEQVGGDEPGVLTFSQFDEPVDAEAPAEEDTIDLEDLPG